MKRTIARRSDAPLTSRLEALREAVELADGRLEAGDVGQGREVLRRAEERLGLAPHVTVAALAGATGSGKSSLFNRLAGSELSRVGVRRPTTGSAHACVWGEDGVESLLDWLGVAKRHRRSDVDPDLEGLVLLDLPDHDSIEVTHRLEVDRLVELVDLLVWVLDPQKYGDGMIHERYLRRLARHTKVMVFVLNHADRLSRDERQACVGDLRRMLEEDGLLGVPILATSARTGEGCGELRGLLADRVAARRAVAERLAADVERVAEKLSGSCDEALAARRVGRRERDRLVAALSEAAGTELVADAVARSHVHRAKLATGWPFTRWLRRLRPDPLARLHLTGPGEGVGRTSLPGPSPIARARVHSALRALAGAVGRDLPDPWPVLILRAAARDEAELPDLLDREVGGAEVDLKPQPRWWRAARALQALLLVVAAASGLWLLALFGLEWLQLPEPPVPRVRELPLPTVLLLAALFTGLLVALVSRQAATVGARRRKGAARRALRARVDALADERVIQPVLEEVKAYERLCAALRRAMGGRSHRPLS